jgi:alkylated DNA nucleotide flippase Atl1
VKEMNEFRLKIARIHQQMLATPRRWASYGDVAEAIGSPGGGKAVGQACIKMLWENGYPTQLFARADGSNGWTSEDLSHINADVVRVLDNMLREARNIPLLPYDQSHRVSLDELRDMAANQDVIIRDYLNMTPKLEEID